MRHPPGVGTRAEVVFLNTSNHEPGTLAGRTWEHWAPVWETHFWNRSFRRVVSLALQEPVPLPQRWALVDWGKGRVPIEARHAVAGPRFPVDGRLLGRSGCPAAGP